MFNAQSRWPFLFASLVLVLSGGDSLASSCCGSRSHSPDPARPACGSAAAREDAPALGETLLHGGRVWASEENAFETVVTPRGVKVYRYSRAGAPRRIDGAKGKVEVRLADGSKRKFDLRPLEPAGGAAAIWFCPMHPQVVRAVAGECPLCGGMQLEVQDFLWAAVDLSGPARNAPPDTRDEVTVEVRLEGLGEPENKAKFSVQAPPREEMLNPALTDADAPAASARTRAHAH